MLITAAKMRVYACISSSACQVFSFSPWYMRVGLGVSKSFGQAKVYQIHEVIMAIQAHQKVIWLDITMNKLL